MEVQQSRRLQNDGVPEDTCPAHEKGAQTGDNPIDGAKLRHPLAAAVEHQQLMPDQHGFGDNGTDSSWPCQSGYGDDQMNQ
jgi:hypothetical protein